ncbi:Arc family DNA-binding protein [Anaeroarcus burkinensis]|uniref:Arc family DNA-binding protein n=1 Tax=Anaeroarcus burkinensis TaxID=82376 RepID=UPI0003F4F2A1|nr:Arc family DNA-binding protein [Anaeroarcus burkinensis]
MTTTKKAFTLRLKDETSRKIRYIAESECRTVTRHIEYVLSRYIALYEKKNGPIE